MYVAAATVVETVAHSPAARVVTIATRRAERPIDRFVLIAVSSCLSV